MEDDVKVTFDPEKVREGSYSFKIPIHGGKEFITRKGQSFLVKRKKNGTFAKGKWLKWYSPFIKEGIVYFYDLRSKTPSQEGLKKEREEDV